MERPNPVAQPRTFDDLKRRIFQWRLTRLHRRPMPEDLWQEAARIARVQGINRTASTLGLNHYSLKKRIEELPKESPAPAAHPAFVEVQAPASFSAAWPGSFLSWTKGERSSRLARQWIPSNESTPAKPLAKNC